MADQKPAPKPAKPAKPVNPALRMMGLPSLPRKLPSRNWLIFWGVSSTLAAAIVYDRREKRRATARWAHAVAPLARELLPDTSAMPRRVTVYLEAPPGDGLRAAQEHFKEYIKPVLASSGLDWEFVVGRRQGDVRAVVAERVRRTRRQDVTTTTEVPTDADLPTDDDVVATVRARNGIPEYAGVKGDIVVGRHTWKEYVRGLHEGWLGPLTAPAAAPAAAPVGTAEHTTTDGATGTGADDLDASPTAPAPTADTPDTPETPKPDEKPEDTAPKRPPQPVPYNSVDDYPSSPLPRLIPAELGPSVPIPFPHLLGFLNTPIRIYRFLHRRRLADDIGREVAAVCFAAATREYREAVAGGFGDADDGCEQQTALAHEEKDWVKSAWADSAEDLKNDPALATRDTPWRRPVVVDPRIGQRMRRFVLSAADEAAARAITVPEEEIEGWTKGKLRQLGRWAGRRWRGDDKFRPNVANLDDE
ncbi:mitochondrial import inner membrane translocase subunit tim-54 [Sporothrix brasiliensis 5110]|uniref:Mitochondrial import inner membrane translocase subunit TIM54 n=1 Tax=Sporothrix brasiliensis 5110 TaxID=1398154 RepID=A0A0C2F7U4_9PEZI|nr:mitochondrial import inner membrane translocase subunit tim-54 [Sporothrix brasiliensis 5110]KIH87113.1 mitochondrial import inner membrane translocase subunit tim-54 [Sporothrix brasiliensis 5110]